MSSKPVPLAATVLLTAASSLFLAGCGGDTVSTTPAPATGSPDSVVDTTTLTPTTLTLTPAPRPQSQCCWSQWGTHYECGNLPAGPTGGHGLCGNDITKNCMADEDCADLVPPSTTPPRTTTTTPRPTTPTTTLPEGACVKTTSRGCFNGQSFDFSEHFVCGQGANIDLYKWGESACCAQGLAFDVHNDFCCNNALSRHGDGQCHEYDPNDDPENCRCPSHPEVTEVTEVTEVAMGAEDTVIIDTTDWQHPAENPCFFAEGAMGCLNGFRFDPSSDLICGQYIVQGDTHGCCSTHDGIKTYNLQTESCCQFGSNTAVFSGAHQCQCRKWPEREEGGCPGLLFSTVI